MWEIDAEGKNVFVTYDVPLEEGEGDEMIMLCEGRNCRKHEYQDSKYGTGKRVFNVTSKKSGEKRIYRCTVCQHEQSEK